MSVDNFKPTLWEGALIHNFHSVSIADAMCTKPASIQGTKVVFNRIGAGTIKDYEGSVDWDAIQTTPIEMEFPKKKYFAFALDDCDRVQLKADVMSATTQEHAALLAEVYDTDFFAELAGGVATGNTIGSASKKIVVTKKSIYDYIVDLGTLLSKKKVPKTDRYVTVDAEILGLLSKDRRFTANPNVLANGFVEGQKINGMQVMCSEEKPANKIVAHYRGAIGAAKQLSETEAMRLQSSFSDGIRGLCRYGSKVLIPEAIALLNYEIGTSVDDAPISVLVSNTEDSPVHTKEVASTPSA